MQLCVCVERERERKSVCYCVCVRECVCECVYTHNFRVNSNFSINNDYLHFEIRNNFQNKQYEYVQGATQTLCLNGVVMALDYF